MQQFNLPDPGEGLTEAEIVSWKVKEGDTVKINDIIVEIETAKSLVELPSPYAGTVAKILVPEGTEVPVGTPIIQIDDGSGPAPEVPAAPAQQPATPSVAEVVAAQPSAGQQSAGGQQFLLPDPGEGLTEAEIVSWKVKVGDTVKINDIIVEIETAKSLVELPSPYAGTVSAILVQEGTEVPVGTPIIVIDDGSGAAAGAPAPAAHDEGQGPNLVGYGSKPSAHTRRQRRPAGNDHPANDAVNAMFAGTESPKDPPTTGDALPHVEDSDAHAPNPTAEQQASAKRAEPVHPSGKVLAKPPVRKFAKDNGIDLAQVPGSGPDGVVTRDDVVSFMKQGPASSQTGPADQAATPARSFAALEDRREPIKGVRKVTAKAMVDSAFQKVHVTEWVDVDVTATMEFIDAIKARRDWRGAKVSPLLIWMKAVCLALGKHPSLNASWDEAAGEIVYHGDINLGFAAATPRGLMVPNIKGAQNLGLHELNDEVQRLIGVARDGKLQPADYARGTFTITNVGVFGVDAGTPIINGDESAILAMGSITRKPWVVGEGADERIEPRWVTTMALSFDHRLIDGEEGSKFLRDVADILVNPGMGLLF